jgi:Flp pilus assembly pilin Flp
VPLTLQPMGELMNKLKSLARKFWTDESAQGATEYILLLVVVVAVVMLFKDKIKGALSDKLNSLGSDIGGFNGN